MDDLMYLKECMTDAGCSEASVQRAERLCQNGRTENKCHKGNNHAYSFHNLLICLVVFAKIRIIFESRYLKNDKTVFIFDFFLKSDIILQLRFKDIIVKLVIFTVKTVII